MAEKFLILGAGAAGINAAAAIKEIKPDSDVTIAFAEDHAYSRMATPYYLTSVASKISLYQSNEKKLSNLDVLLMPNYKAISIDRRKKVVMFANRKLLNYDKLLIATGSSSILPDSWKGIDNLVSLWDLKNVEKFKNDLADINKIAIIGSGFIGMIFADSLLKLGKSVTIIEKMPYIIPGMLPITASQIMKNYMQKKGVDVIVDDSVDSIEPSEHKIKIKTASGKKIIVNKAVAAIGIKPNIDFLEGSGVKTDNGIFVDENMRTNDDSIYAAGDAAIGQVVYSQKRAIHPIWPTAVDHGSIAGYNMAGIIRKYRGSLLYNILVLGNLQCASFGNWNDPHAKIFEWRSSDNRQFLRFTVRSNRLVGASIIGNHDRIGMIKGMVEQAMAIDDISSFVKNIPDFTIPFMNYNYLTNSAYQS